MSNSTPHTIRLQDGSLCNLSTRITQPASTLLSYLETIPDPRSKQGRRHSATLVLFMVFVGLLRGSKDLKDVQLQPFFCEQVGFVLPHGIPDPTTIARLLERINPDDLIRIYLKFLQTLGMSSSNVLSYDGTMRAVGGEAATRHILSFFSHDTHLALGQVGVTGKGREIPAFEQLLKQGEASDLIAGTLLLGDALHTQKATVKATLKAGADYLFVVKGNQKQLGRAITAELSAAKKMDLNYFEYKDTKRQRDVTTTVTVLQTRAGGTDRPKAVQPLGRRCHDWPAPPNGDSFRQRWHRAPD